MCSIDVYYGMTTILLCNSTNGEQANNMWTVEDEEEHVVSNYMSEQPL